MADRLWHARWRVGCTLAVAAAGLGFDASRARASDAEDLVALDWVAPEGCPDAARVEREVSRLLADVSAAGGPYLQARANVRQEESGVWHVELRTTGPEGSGVRTVTAESCQALADATALILALAVDPERVAANGSAVVSPSRASKQTGPSAQVGRKEGATQPSISARSVYFAVDASVMLDVGTLPAAAPGFAAKLAVTPGAFPPLRLEIGAGLFLGEATASPPERSGTFSLRTFDAGGCMVAPWGHLEVGACASAEIAWMSAAGLYEGVTARGEAEWVVLRPRATLAYHGSSLWAIRADVGIGLDLGRPEFIVAGAEQGLIFQPARWTGRGALGLEVRF